MCQIVLVVLKTMTLILLLGLVLSQPIGQLKWVNLMWLIWCRWGWFLQLGLVSFFFNIIFFLPKKKHLVSKKMSQSMHNAFLTLYMQYFEKSTNKKSRTLSIQVKHNTYLTLLRAEKTQKVKLKKNIKVRYFNKIHSLVLHVIYSLVKICNISQLQLI